MMVTLEADRSIGALQAALAGAERPRQLAQIKAANDVAALTRTQVVAEVRARLALSAGSVRKRIKVFRATLRKPWARLWAGTRVGVPLYEGTGRKDGRSAHNPGVRQAAPTAQVFEARMKSGHKGLFYRATPGGAPRTGKRIRDGVNDLPIREVRVHIGPAADSVMEPKAKEIWRARHDDLFWRDFNRRLARLGWR